MGSSFPLTVLLTEITPVGELRYEGDVAHINNGEIGEVTHKLYNTLTGIQWGKLPDELGWTVKID